MLLDRGVTLLLSTNIHFIPRHLTHICVAPTLNYLLFPNKIMSRSFAKTEADFPDDFLGEDDGKK